MVTPAESMPKFASAELDRFSREVLESLGIEPKRAAKAAKLLVNSDLRGIDSHGVARLWVYAKWLGEGHANPRPEVRTLRETPSTIALHGDGGLGIVVGPEANERVIEKARDVGSAWGTISHSNHFGIAGNYALRAVEEDMIGMVFSNATAQMYPVGSFQPMLGTNPIAFAFPAGDEPPIVVDMATSAGAFGKIEIANRTDQPIPDGWVKTRQGEPINDPARVYKEEHSLSPLGCTDEHAVHKGYCLASVADLLGGVLSGAAWGPHCPHFFFPDKPYSDQTKSGLGHCFTAMRIDAFMEPSEFKSRVDEWIRTFRKTAPADPNRPVMVPGDPERKAIAQRSEHGIPLTRAVHDSLLELASQLDLKPPAQSS